MELLKALGLTVLVIAGLYAFPVFASAAIMHGDWSHVAAAAIAVVMTTAIAWLAEDKLK